MLGAFLLVRSGLCVGTPASGEGPQNAGAEDASGSFPEKHQLHVSDDVYLRG